MCFITPNEVFFKYVDNVLPELGEDNAVNMTMNEVARTIMKMDLYKNRLRVENKIDYLEKIINGKKEFNAAELLLDMYIYLNSNKYGNDLFIFDVVAAQAFL